jgi:hypothetical protein
VSLTTGGYACTEGCCVITFDEEMTDEVYMGNIPRPMYEVLPDVDVRQHDEAEWSAAEGSHSLSLHITPLDGEMRECQCWADYEARCCS